MDVSAFLPPYHHPLAVYGVIAVLLIVIPLVFTKLKIPVIIGLITAGIAVGPFGFHILEKDAAVDLPATIGLLYIMFLAGLEIDLLQFTQRKKDSAVFGILTFIIPLGMGTAAGIFFIRIDLPSSILLASMFSSHTLITYPIISRFGLAKSRSSVAAVGGTILTDIIAILILAVIAGNARGNLSYLFLMELAGFLFFTVVMIRFIVPVIGKYFFRRIAPDDIIQYCFVLAVMFLFSLTADIMGLEKIIGAFLAGLALNRLIPEKSSLMNRIRFIGNALFIPVFLISVGMLIDLRHMLISPRAWIIAGVMSAIAVVSKAAAAGLTGCLLKMNLKEGLLLFGMSVNQAAATLAAVLVGYSLGLFDEDILSGTIIMIMVTISAGTFVTERAGRYMALEEQKTPSTYIARPQRFVVAVKDQTNLSLLLDLAFYIRPENSHEAVYPVMIISGHEPEGNELDAAERVMTDAVLRGSSHGIPLNPVIRSETQIQEGIFRSFRDNRGTILITQWTGPKYFYSGIYSTIIDGILEKLDEAMLVCRMCTPLNGTSRIVVILPPFIEKLEGFQEALSLLKTLSSAINAGLSLQTTNKKNAAVIKTVMSRPPRCSCTVDETLSLQHLPNALTSRIQQTDLIVLFNIRIGRPAWRPRLNRLPGMFCRSFPYNNFISLYPCEKITGGEAVRTANGPQLRTTIDPQTIFSTEGFETFNALISAFIEKMFPLLPEEDKSVLFSTITRIVTEEAIQIKEDVLLVHAHVPCVERVSVFYIFDKGKSGFQEMKNNKVLVMLLGPKDLSPEVHLQTLSQLVRLVKNDHFVGDIVAARNFYRS
ncbi:MAG: cation:proton antiporter [Spirochaetales bacterium]|nr:cation:proton antiporter [Spirochaetales bacterium]